MCLNISMSKPHLLILHIFLYEEGYWEKFDLDISYEIRKNSFWGKIFGNLSVTDFSDRGFKQITLCLKKTKKTTCTFLHLFEWPLFKSQLYASSPFTVYQCFKVSTWEFKRGELRRFKNLKTWFAVCVCV